MADKDLEARVQALEEIEAIKQLKARYCYLVDSGKWREVVKLFAKDSKISFPFGAGEGIAAIITFYRETLPSQRSFIMHTLHNPIIEVKGEQATGKWYYQSSGTVRSANRAQWGAGIYRDKFVKESGDWKFKEIIVESIYSTPYDEGWAKTVK
ncbi:MAG: nuclear transport factor 2 family protein [Chloroflexota bacterium]